MCVQTETTLHDFDNSLRQPSFQGEQFERTELRDAAEQGPQIDDRRTERAQCAFPAQRVLGEFPGFQCKVVDNSISEQAHAKDWEW